MPGPVTHFNLSILATCSEGEKEVKLSVWCCPKWIRNSRGKKSWQIHLPHFTFYITLVHLNLVVPWMQICCVQMAAQVERKTAKKLPQRFDGRKRYSVSTLLRNDKYKVKEAGMAQFFKKLSNQCILNSFRLKLLCNLVSFRIGVQSHLTYQ